MDNLLVHNAVFDNVVDFLICLAYFEQPALMWNFIEHWKHQPRNRNMTRKMQMVNLPSILFRLSFDVKNASTIEYLLERVSQLDGPEKLQIYNDPDLRHAVDNARARKDFIMLQAMSSIVQWQALHRENYLVPASSANTLDHPDEVSTQRLPRIR